VGQRVDIKQLITWRGLAELPSQTGRARGETALIFAPPAAIGALAAAFAPVEVGIAAGGFALVASTTSPRCSAGVSPRGPRTAA